MSVIHFSSNELGNVLRALAPHGREYSEDGRRLFHLTAGYLAVYSRANSAHFAERYNEQADPMTAEQIIADAPTLHEDDRSAAFRHLRLFVSNAGELTEDESEAVIFLQNLALDALMARAEV